MMLMRRTLIYSFIAFMLSVSTTGCKHNSTPVVRQTLDSVLVSGRLEYYGAFYKTEGIDYDVVSLDLYARGVGLNSEGRMEGVGTNLYVSDIFVPSVAGQPGKISDCLPAGTYYSDSVAREMHFLRGQDYDGNYGGSYVLLKNETGYVVYPMTVGEMTVSYSGDSLVLDGRATLQGQKQPYSFHYRDTMPVIRSTR